MTLDLTNMAREVARSWVADEELIEPCAREIIELLQQVQAETKKELLTHIEELNAELSQYRFGKQAERISELEEVILKAWTYDDPLKNNLKLCSCYGWSFGFSLDIADT